MHHDWPQMTLCDRDVNIASNCTRTLHTCVKSSDCGATNGEWQRYAKNDMS